MTYDEPILSFLFNSKCMLKICRMRCFHTMFVTLTQCFYITSYTSDCIYRIRDFIRMSYNSNRHGDAVSSYEIEMEMHINYRIFIHFDYFILSDRVFKALWMPRKNCLQSNEKMWVRFVTHHTNNKRITWNIKLYTHTRWRTNEHNQVK